MIYRITMPITGYVYKEVEADNEDEALAKFYSEDIISDDIEEWDTVEHIVTGNVFHGCINDVEIEEIE